MHRRSPCPPYHAVALLITLLLADSAKATEELVVYGKKPAETLRRSAETVSIVTGEELRARGARDLVSALAGVSGIQIAPGGDGGPASSVPAIQGLREFDAFLLLVDGVPLGAAYTPLLAGLSMAGVERIEVIKGAAPVGYGTTSFVGVINVVHYAPGESPERISVGAGSREGRSAALSFNLPATLDAKWQHSVMLDARGQDASVDRSRDATLHALYRGSAPIGRMMLGMDLELQAVDQDPASPHPREGQDLSARFPRDANVNPRDARLDENRSRLALHATTPTALGEWDTRLAFTRIDNRTTRGFLREDFPEDGSTPNADGYAQAVRRDEWYFDSHLSHTITDDTLLVAGIDWIGGDGEQRSRNFEYAVLPDGSNAPRHDALAVDERTTLENSRYIAGAYADLDLELGKRWRVELGARYTRVDDQQYGREEPSEEAPPPGERGSRSDGRWSGAVESSYALWSSGDDYLTLYGSYRSTFKPAVVDFGPEAQAHILRPEDTEGVEAGLRGKVLDGRVRLGASAFNTSFHNLVVSQAVNGLPIRVNAGDTTLEGYELEAEWQLVPGLELSVNWARHAARFDDYVQLFGSGLQQLRGNYLEMSPKTLASVGVRYEPGPQGPRAWLTANRSGEFYLNKRNTARRDGYTTVDAGVGLRFGDWDLHLTGSNLGNRRDPVAESELGDAQYYRLPERSIWLGVDLALD